LEAVPARVLKQKVFFLLFAKATVFGGIFFGRVFIPHRVFFEMPHF